MYNTEWHKPPDMNNQPWKVGRCTGISFVDSTPIRVCHNKRIKRNKVFKDLAQVGKSTMGWFYSFKLHIVINEKGKILNFAVIQANVDDRQPLKNESFLRAVFGKLFADKGYISQKLTEILFTNDIHLITGIRNNMKNSILSLSENYAAQTLSNRNGQRWT